MQAMDERHLQERLRHAAEQVAALATAPGADAAVRRGRRRNRHRTGAALLALAALTVGALGGTRLATAVAERPAATAPVGPAAVPFPPVPVGPRARPLGEPWSAVRIAQHDRHYRLAVYWVQDTIGSRRQRLCIAFQAADLPPSSSAGLCTTGDPRVHPSEDPQVVHGRIANLPPNASTVDGVAGRVSSRVARVRVWLRRGQVLLPPVTVAVVDGGAAFPGRYFAMLAPKAARYHALDLLDTQGRLLCPDSSSCHP